MNTKTSISTLVLTVLSWLLINSATAQVAINTTGTEANPSAMLDVSSNEKGVLIPRMTASERNAITSPAGGLLVFVTDDNSFYYYDNTNWIKVLNDDTTDGDWEISGDYVYVSSAKNIGIGTSTPDGKLVIENSSAGNSLKITANYTGNINNGISSVVSGSGTYDQYGIKSTITNTGDGRHYGLYSNLTGAGAGKQYGVYQNIDNTGAGIHYGSYTNITGTGEGKQYGDFISMLNTGSEDHYCDYRYVGGSGSGSQYGTYTKISNTGNGIHYGVYNSFNGASDGINYGVYNSVLATGNGIHYGLYNYLAGSGTGKKYGIYTSFYAGAGGTHYGIYVNALGAEHYAALLRGKLYVKDNQTAVSEPHNALTTIYSTETDTALFVDVTNGALTDGYGILTEMSGTGTGYQYAAFNLVNNTSDGKHYGVGNMLSGSANGIQYGVFNEINNTGNAIHYGTFNYLTGSGTGKKYGNYVNITSTAKGTHYGNYTLLDAANDDNKYGSYISIPVSAGGTHYGIYSTVSGSTNYSGYFTGRVYMKDNVGIGVLNPAVKLDVFGDFQVKNSGSPAVANIESGNDVAEITIKSGGPGDDARIRFFTGGLERAMIGFDIDNDRFFIKEGAKNIFIDNGAMLPETHRTQNLGSSTKAWNDIYYDDLHNMGASAFGGRTPSEEIVNYPPKEKLPGSFDYKTERGDVELDPASVPPGLADNRSLLTDEMASYNYKTNYEQQLIINKQKEIINKQNKKIEKLETLLIKLEQRVSGLEKK